MKNTMACAALFALFFLIYSSSAQNSAQDYVDAHNAARAQVGVAGVTWDATLAAYAENYANQMVDSCDLVHSGGPYGENLAKGSGGDFTGVSAVNSWVAESQYYDHTTNTCSAGKECGHYTQVVWQNSKSIGCAGVLCSNEWYFVICSYDPPGNVVGESPY